MKKQTWGALLVAASIGWHCGQPAAPTTTAVAPPAPADSVKPSLTGVWFLNNGNFWEGLQLEDSGRLAFPNVYSMTGDRWQREGDQLILYSYTDRYPEPQPTRYQIMALTADTLTLAIVDPRIKAVPVHYVRQHIQAETDKLLGRWWGPEGTMADILPDSTGRQYSVQLYQLDGLETYAATPEANKLRIVRQGKAAYLEPTDGAGTGMKWLAEKKRCIRLADGHGYCRE